MDRGVDASLLKVGLGVRLHMLAIALLLPYSNGDLRLEDGVFL